MRHAKCSLLESAGAVLALVVLGFGVAGAAGAAEAEGCRGSANSFTKDGAPLDQLQAPGAGGTRSDPFDVDYDGTVRWEGSTAAAITSGAWKVDLGLPVDISGSFTNAGAKTASAGTDVVKDRVGVKVTGLFHVKVSVTGEGGTCSGRAWVRITDSPLFTPLWFGGLILAVGGLALAVPAALPRKGV